MLCHRHRLLNGDEGVFMLTPPDGASLVFSGLAVQARTLGAIWGEGLKDLGSKEVLWLGSQVVRG